MSARPGGGTPVRPGGAAAARPGGGIAKPSAPKPDWGSGNILHNRPSGPATPARPEVRPGQGSRPSGDRRPEARPGAGTWDGNRSQIGQQPNRPVSPKADIDSASARKLLQDRGFSNTSDLRRALDAKGLHGPSDVRKALDEHGGAHRDSLHKALSDKGFDPSKVDRSKIAEAVRNRPDIHKPEISRQTADRIQKHFHDKYPHGPKDFWTKEWHDRHPNGWRPPRPIPPPHWWGPPPSWHRCWNWFAAGFFTGRVIDGIVDPIWYNYGSNIYYVDNTVYVNGTEYAGGEEFYEQAYDLAAIPLAAPTTSSEKDAEEEWMPLGTFAVLKEPDQEDCNLVLQLAMNKSGHIAGNLIDVVKDGEVAVSGAVDPKTQRVAFHVEGHENVVMECGLANLTQETLTVLLHFDKDHTEERTLVRLSVDGAAEGSGTDAVAP